MKGVIFMEEDVIKELKINEKIIVKIFTKTFNKVSNFTRVKTINYLLKN